MSNWEQLNEVTAERDAALKRVAELEAAAREVVFAPVGRRRATCNSEALQALESLVPDDIPDGDNPK